MHTLRSKALTFFKDEDGGPTVEFVIIFPILFFFVGFILLLAFDFFWMLTMQKAVERGARMAVTQLPIAGALVDQGRIINYELITTADVGASCEPGGNCAAVATYSCRGGGYINQNTAALCDATRFTEIYNEVRRFAPNSIVPADVTITYEDSGLGRATESYIPLVTVELNQGNGLSSFKWLDGIFSFGNAVQPSVAAAFVGENLGN